MTTAALPMMYENRERVAWGGALLLGVLLALAIAKLAIQHEPAPVEDPIRITLADPPPEVPKAKPEIEPPKPVQRPKPVEHVRQNVHAEPVQQVAATPSPVPETAPVNVPDAPLAPLAKPAPRIEEAPVVQRNAAAEGRFAQDVRMQIERKKIYPDSARDLGMSGVVEVVYVLDRTGKLVTANIAVSSGYPVLDQAAVSAVRAARFASFPADAWVGENQKEFRTKLVFFINY